MTDAMDRETDTRGTDSGSNEATTIGRYALIRKMTQRENGGVWQARDTALGRVVALEADVGEHREAQLLARIEHPGFARLYDVFEHEGTTYAVTEWIEGRTLRDLLLEKGALPLERAVSLMQQLAAAVAHAHARLVVHGDIKPENIVVRRDGTAVLIDLGLARVEGHGSPTGPALTGTLSYMAPELLGGQPPDRRTDVHAMGVLFYELLAGRPPFGADDNTPGRIRNGDAPHIGDARTDTPSGIATLIARMLERTASERPPIAEVAFGLRSATEEPTADDATTRQVTVAVLASEGGAPERTHALSDAVTSLGGTVLLHSGSRIAFCVGYPSAREHGCEDAAALLLDAVTSDPNARAVLESGAASVEVRSGRVAVVSPLVDTVLDAAPLVPAGGVVAGPGAASVLSSTLTLGDPVALPGPSGTVDGVRVVGDGRPSQRMIARERELSALDHAWQRAQRGRGAAVLVAGEAGIGKSNLVRSWSDRAQHPTWLAQSKFPEQYAAFSSLRGLLLGSVLQLPSGAAPQAVEDALVQRGVRERPWLDAVQQALFGTAADTPAPSRASLYDHLAGLLLTLASSAPRTLILEDAHWLDQPSWAVFQRMAERCTRRPLLMLFVCRPEFAGRWQGRLPTVLDVPRLAEVDAETLVRAVAGATDLPSRAVRDVVQYSAGIPLLLEQLTFALVRASGDSAGLSSTPTSLRESVQRRLEGLGETRQTLDAFAVLGPYAPWDLVVALCGEEARVSRHLDEAANLDLVDEGDPPTFRHALVREAVYDAIGPEARDALHRRVVELLTTRFPAMLEQHPARYARHFVVAGEPARAIELYEQAALEARRSWSYEDACSHFTTARELLEAHAEAGEDRDRRERELLRGHYPAATAVYGWADDHVQGLLARGKAIDESLGDRPALPAIWGQWIMSLISHNQAGVAEAFSAMEAAGDSPEVRFLQQLSQGVTAFHSGDLDRSQALLHQARHTVLGSLSGGLPSEDTLDLSAASGWSEEVLSSPALYLAVIETCRGRFAEAEALQREAEDIAERLGSPYAKSFCFGSRTVHALLRNDPDFVAPVFDQLVELCAGDADWLVYGRAQLGMAKGLRAAEAGDLDAATAEFGQAVGIIRAMGFLVSSELQAATCADLNRRAGNFEAAHEHLDAALSIVDHEFSTCYAPRVFLVAARVAQDEGAHDKAQQFRARAQTALARLQTTTPAITLTL
jgi:tetratricopeptide (TPR) repeat protein